MLSRRSRPLAASFGALALTASLLATGATSVAAESPDQASAAFTFLKISFPGDQRFTQLLGINDHNVIAGYHGDENTENTPNKGFTSLPPNFTEENFPNSVQTQVIGINNDGDTVGFYIDQGGNTHGFLKSKDFTNVDLPGTTFNQLLGINNKGQAAGYFQDAAGLQHSYVRDGDGNFLVLNIPMPSNQATGINDDGTVVGFEQSSPAATTASGYILKDGKVTVLNYPNSTFTQALGINGKDEVVGTYTDAVGNGHGFVYRDGHYLSVDVPGAANTVINGVNDDGRLVGFFSDGNGNTIGAVGEPGTGATAPTTITFDDLQNPNRPLNGQYPSGVANFGNNAWFLSGPYDKFTTNSISFPAAGPTSASVSFDSPRRLVRIDADNGGTTSSDVTLACSGQPTVSAHLGEKQLSTITTSWSQPCSTVTLTSSNGWYTNFDNIVIE
jgi:hypothetical protein